MRFIVYDAAGRIVNTGTCPDTADLSIFPRVLSFDDTYVLPELETAYVDNGQVFTIPQKPANFYEFDYVTKTWIPQLPAAKVFRIKEAFAEYLRRKELPLNYDAKTLDTDDEAREQLMFKAFEFAERARLNQPAGGASRVWENADGTFHVFATDAGFRNWLGGFVITLSDRTAQQRLALRTHVQNIRALTTVEDVLAYDITTGWPT